MDPSVLVGPVPVPARKQSATGTPNLRRLWQELRTRLYLRDAPGFRPERGGGYLDARWAQSFALFREDVLPLLPPGEVDSRPGLVLACEDSERGFRPGNVRFVRVLARR